MSRQVIKPYPGQSHKSTGVIQDKGIRAPFDNALAESKSFSFDPIEVNSPAGVLCTVSGITATIFRANHANGGYDCYVSFMGALNGGRGYTSAAWVGYNPPGGLSLSVIQTNNHGGFLGTFDIPPQDVGCGDRNRIFTARQDIDPDLYPLTESMWILTNASTWYGC
jgi:hypothetical protein